MFVTLFDYLRNMKYGDFLVVGFVLILLIISTLVLLYLMKIFFNKTASK